MKSSEKASFVYRWRNLQTGEWYVGYHTGTEDDGYICSSSVARPRIQQQPEIWQRRILRWGTRAEMTALERRILKRLAARRNARSLNRHNGNGHTGTGRLPGSLTKNGDLNKGLLRKLTAEQLVNLLGNETDRTRRVKIHAFLLDLVFKK